MPLFIEVPGIRRLALRGPGPLKVRDEEEATLVEERQMRPKLLSVFLYAASDTASNGRWPARPAVTRGVPVSGSSTPGSASASRHAPGGTSRDTAFRSLGQSVPGSTSRWRSRRPARPSTAAGLLAASGKRTAVPDDPARVVAANRPSPSADSFAATERLNLPMPLPLRRSPASCILASSVGWRAGDVSPTGWAYRRVSCIIGYP